jgi:hypothetical protein
MRQNRLNTNFAVANIIEKTIAPDFERKKSGAKIFKKYPEGMKGGEVNKKNYLCQLSR